MKINDKGGMFSDHDTIQRVVAEHPLHSGLSELIAVLDITHNTEIGASRASIKYDSGSKNAVLLLSTPLPMNEHTEYVLLHEFTHVIDRGSPAFRFSDSEKSALTSREHWRFMDLWNLLIDSRLNAVGHFVLEDVGSNPTGTTDRKPADCTVGIKRKLVSHIRSLRSTGLVNAKAVVRGVWANPSSLENFNDLIAVIKT
jgi:hypothetical protein